MTLAAGPRTWRALLSSLLLIIGYSPVAAGMDVTVRLQDGCVGADNRVSIDVTLSSGGARVGGIQTDILFDTAALRLALSDCKINPAIGGTPNGQDCADDPSIGPCKDLLKALGSCGGAGAADGCPPQTPSNISRLRAVIVALAVPNFNQIPDGVLYTCTFTVLTAAKLPQTLHVMNVAASDPGSAGTAPVPLCGPPLPDCLASDGAVTGSCPTPQAFTPTATASITPSPTASATATPTVTASPTPCVGSCDGGTSVTVDDLVTMVSVAIGEAPVSACAAGDVNQDRQITVDEILAAVENALHGCGTS